MADPVRLLFQGMKDWLSAVRVSNGYHTDMGATVILGDVQRKAAARPSFAIGPNSGSLDIADETDENGRLFSGRARRIAFTVEAAVVAGGQDAYDAGLDMLDDFDRLRSKSPCLALPNVKSVRFKTWSILDRPDGIDAVVLQILGEAEYLRPTTT